jgi:POT family proton-dependent oligopeptide transporter
MRKSCEIPRLPVSPSPCLPLSPPPRGKYYTAPLPSAEMPKGIPYIVGNEAAERFSYYGMATILFVFLTEYLRGRSGQLAPMPEHLANQWTHNFFAAVYAFPLVGAILSDWLLGKYRSIVTISLLYCLGHAVLAVMDYPLVTGMDPRWMLAVGLALIAVGAGGIKPCVSAHVGDQFGTQNQHLIAKVFGWFYFSINLGSTASTLLTPWLLERYGPGWAFGVPGILMGLATLVFWMGRYKFVHIPPGGSTFFRETFSRNGLRAVANLIPLYLLILPFFSLFDQQHTSWVDQAKKMDCVILGYNVLPSQIQAFNPILIMVFIPLFAYGVYPLLGRCFRVTPLRKIGIGLFLSGAAFAVVAIAQRKIDAGQTPHVAWQLAAYVVMTAAEVMVSITALEFSYTQAPRKMKSFVMGVFFLCSIALGNYFTAQVNGSIERQKELGAEILKGANYFWFFTIVMLATAVVFVAWSQFYRGQTYIQGDVAQ